MCEEKLCLSEPPSLTECAAGLNSIRINIARWCDGLRRPRGSFPRLGWHQRPYVTLEQQLKPQWLGHSGEKNQHDIRFAFAFLVNGINIKHRVRTSDQASF